jgi:DNA-binding GntR family transcriptional regulator
MHRKGPTLVAETSGPDYQRIADDLLERIRSGEYAVGTAIPSTPRLEKQYGVSKTPVRQAVDQLRRDGVLTGQSGKAVYVRAMPDAAAAELRDLRALGEAVAERKCRTEGYTDLEKTVSRLEANLRELYGKTAFDYPDDEDGQQERMVRHG